MNRREIVETILSQLGGQSKLVAMTGANLFTYSGNNGLLFHFKGCKEFNRCQIMLNSMDLYDVSLFRIRKYEIKNMEKLENIYADQLKEIFENKTGLRLSL